MSEQMNEPTPELPRPSGMSEWFSVWRDAVTKPNEQTFSRIASSPNAKLTTALLWVFLGALVSAFLTALVPNVALNQVLQNYNVNPTQFGGGVGSFLIRVICGAPIAAVIGVVFFIIGVGIVHLLAKMFGGRGTFDQLAYAMAAIQTPLALVTGILGLLAAIPYAGYCFSALTIVVGLYALVLFVMAVKGVNRFGWGQAAASLLLPVLLLCCCLSVGILGIVNAIRTNMPNFPNQFLTPAP